MKEAEKLIRSVHSQTLLDATDSTYQSSRCAARVRVYTGKKKPGFVQCSKAPLRGQRTCWHHRLLELV